MDKLYFTLLQLLMLSDRQFKTHTNSVYICVRYRKLLIFILEDNGTYKNLAFLSDKTSN